MKGAEKYGWDIQETCASPRVCQYGHLLALTPFFGKTTLINYIFLLLYQRLVKCIIWMDSYININSSWEQRQYYFFSQNMYTFCSFSFFIELVGFPVLLNKNSLWKRIFVSNICIKISALNFTKFRIHAW